MVYLASTTTQADEQPTAAEHFEFFEREVRPLLVQHCYECHSTQSKRVEANLLLDSRASHLHGGDSGAAIVPGDAHESLLIDAVHYDSYEMPPKGKLSDQDIQTLVRWIEIGAPWPDEPAPVAHSTQDDFDLEKRKTNFWAWQPLTTLDPPTVQNIEWPNNDIDLFILSQLEQAHIKPSRDAERTAILRRLYFDLIGLPPTADEVKAFIQNKKPQATEHAVDQLLESPHFGERWGRHWLDIVRYAESRGHEFDNDTPNAFQYRDYVIRAINADVPYDQFVREHIAGDLLANPRLHPKEHFNESVLGTGFWFLGEWVHSPVDIRKDEADRFDNMIDVFSKTFLGVTVACARCHDHKYDAISTADYYSLSGFLQSSDYRQVRFESMEQNRKTATELAEINTTHQRQIHTLLESSGIRAPDNAPELTDDCILFNYSDLPHDDFLQDGFIFGLSPRRAGEPYLNNDTGQLKISTFGAAVNDPFWNGLESITEGSIQNQSVLTKIPKSGRTLRSPTFELKDGEVHCLVDGAGHIVACVDSHRLVAGPLHQKTVVRIKEGQRWVRLNLDRYVGHRVHLEFIPEPNKQIAVRLAVQGLSKNELASFEERINESNRKYEEYAKTVEGILNNDTETETDLSARDIASSWKGEREQLASQIVRTSRLALSMMDGTGEDDRILIRGNSAKPGQIEPRHFLTAISGDKPLAIKKGSGRLQLAELVNDPTNPLTSRVIVNRIWHHLMGRGIVPTTDDFGFLGQRPTHPHLLDHLATRFLQEGRSIKSMIKYIVLSRTYQMSSHASQKAQELDPSNLLWHHCPPKRLQGEAIRDSLLTLSGRLDTTAFGPPVPIHLTSFMNGRGRPKKSGSLDGDGRRSIYISVRRNFLSPFMLAFDTPTPFSSMGRRNVSNVPAQPLILLNDPLVVELADDWSKQAVKKITGTGFDAVSNRIEWMYLSAFGRYPTEQEIATSIAFLSSKTSDNKAYDFNDTCWSELAHALVNTKEFIFLR
ncbi:MAG: DUF1553 domain-containing protein [Planctomycetaceae bacterium]|nr:DUF1553 domain-containing protein [Planctomycetaceae bacterium]